MSVMDKTRSPSDSPMMISISSCINDKTEAGEMILDEPVAINASLLTAIFLWAEGHLERTGDIL